MKSDGADLKLMLTGWYPALSQQRMLSTKALSRRESI
jgi:hypothetical protein